MSATTQAELTLPLATNITRSSVVPRLYVGFARQFIRQIDEQSDALGKTIDNIVDPLRQRWRVRRLIRREQLAEAERRWTNDLPQHGRLMLRTERDGYSLRIADLRVTAGSLRFDNWHDDDTEPNVSLQVISVQIDKRTFVTGDEVLCVVSMHSLARWHERTRNNDKADLERDLLRLVVRHRELMRGPADFRCETASGGAWLGKRVSASFANARKNDAMMLSVRTFLNNE